MPDLDVPVILQSFALLLCIAGFAISICLIVDKDNFTEEEQDETNPVNYASGEAYRETVRDFSQLPDCEPWTKDQEKSTVSVRK